MVRMFASEKDTDIKMGSKSKAKQEPYVRDIRLLLRVHSVLLSEPSGFGQIFFFDGRNVDETATVATLGEEDCAVDQCVDCVVLAHAYVEAGVVDSAALALDDIAGLGELAAEDFNAESFAFRLTAVLRTTDAFLMCHSALCL